MEGFKKPSKKASSYRQYLFIDGEQVGASLSSIEGGTIDEARGRSLNGGKTGGGAGAGLGVSGAKLEANFSKDSRFEYEEEVIRERTGESKLSDLLQKLREDEALGFIPTYGPKIYEQIEEGELYEFKANLRLHPFHQFVSAVRGWESASRRLGENDKELARIAKEAEEVFYGKDKGRKRLSVFADTGGTPPEYKIAMQLDQDQILVNLEDLQGEATFVAQIHRKIKEGTKVPAARLVRDTPLVAQAEEQMMLEMLPAFQDIAGEEQLGVEATRDDVILRNPAIIVKPLCVYKGS